MIIRLKKILIKNNRFKNSLAINKVYLIYSVLKIMIRNGFRFTDIKEYRNKKKSNTAVILGAGSSINDLNTQQMNELSKFDVVGLSYSCIINIRQKFYFYECASNNEKKLMKEHADKVFPAALSAYSKGMIENFYWKNSENKVFEKFVDIARYPKQLVCNVLTDNPKIFKKILKWHAQVGLHKFFLLQARGSVTALIHFAAILKYEKVIFVGVDLNDKGYFFEHSNLNDKYNFGSPYKVLDNSDETLYRPNDPKLGTPIIQYIETMTSEMIDTNFYVFSKKSVLSSLFNQWKFKS